MPAPLDPLCLFEVLDEYEVDYVLIGGLAAVIHGSTAMTNDADIVPAPETENLERLSGALVDLGARIRSAETPDGVPFEPHPSLLRSMAMLNTTTRCGDLDIAFAGAPGSGYEDFAASCVVYDLGGVEVRVASVEDIIRSKERADRPKDRATLPILRALREEIEARGHIDN